MAKKKKQKKYDNPKHMIDNHFVLGGDDLRKLEKLENKVIDLLMDKYGKDIGVMSAVNLPRKWDLTTAAERAEKRLAEHVPMPWGRSQAHTHAYVQAIRYARRVLSEEMTRYHGR